MASERVVETVRLATILEATIQLAESDDGADLVRRGCTIRSACLHPADQDGWDRLRFEAHKAAINAVVINRDRESWADIGEAAADAVLDLLGFGEAVPRGE